MAQALTPKTALVTYKHFKITMRGGEALPAGVFDPRYPRNPALYRASTLEAAKRWVDAYRDGVTWAVVAAAEQAAEQREALTLTDLPASSPSLYIMVEDGTDVGIGTADEIRELVEDGIHAADGLTFRLELGL
jgi:hypothetical protein